MIKIALTDEGLLVEANLNFYVLRDGGQFSITKSGARDLLFRNGFPRADVEWDASPEDYIWLTALGPNENTTLNLGN